MDRDRRFRKFKSAFRNLKSTILLSAMLFALCVPASAQEPKKVPRIGYLTTLPTTLDSNRRQEIRRTLQELGYVEGQNISTLYRSAEGDTARLPELAAELVKLKVDVIVVAGGFGRSARPRMRPNPFQSL